MLLCGAVTGVSLDGSDADGFCKSDWISIDSCVPEGGSRSCGNISTATCKLKAEVLYILRR